MRFEYLVVPFIGQAKRSWIGEQGPAHVAADLQNLLNFHSTEGWEYVRVETIEIVVRVGCFVGIIFGKRAGTYTFHQVVFRRPVAAA